MLTQQDVLDIFRSAHAILEGHFILSSGLHSPVFLQKALVYRYPEKTDKLCKALADKIKAEHNIYFDTVAAPALGGLIPGFVTAGHLTKPFIWVERENGTFQLRRGFNVQKKEKVLIVEDIITTGLSVRETIDCLQKAGAEVVGCACLIDRSGGKADLGVPMLALTSLDIPAFKADQLPPELQAIPAIKPGSRGLA
jgi:orotate phosphoribosyltransferase